MNEGFEQAVLELNDPLEKRFKPDSQVRLRSLVWTLRDAPDVGLEIAHEVAETMKQGRHMDDDPVQDMILTVQLMQACDQRSHFALESTIRYLHASGDLLAQMVNDALGLSLEESVCSLSRVLVPLSAVSTWSRIAGALRRFETSTEYRYVADATNRMKHRNAHRSTIRARVDDTGEVDVKQGLAPFEHSARSHDETEAAEIRANVDALQSRTAEVLDELRAALIAGDVPERSDE